MKRVSINGLSYAMPFVELLRPLTAEEFAALRADIIAVRGVQQAITTAITPNWGRVVVDGGHRATIAEELGLDVPVTSLGDLSAEEARDRCLALNVNRRHLTIEEQQQARAKRIARVVEARRNGKSIGAIAREMNISKTQVARDLDDRPADSLPLPTHITGTNGAVHRAKQLGSRKSKATQPPQVAAAAMRTLCTAVRAMLRGQYRTRLEMIATALGAPLDGDEWPALEKLRAIIRDVASGSSANG